MSRNGRCSSNTLSRAIYKKHFLAQGIVGQFSRCRKFGVFFLLYLMSNNEFKIDIIILFSVFGDNIKLFISLFEVFKLTSKITTFRRMGFRFQVRTG